MKKRDPVVHFEMPAEDTKRMADFYSMVFGWEARFFGEDMGNYVTVNTTEVDENNMPKSVGSINGGFFPKKDSPSKYPSLVISVDNIRDSMQKVMEAGGEIQGEPVDIPGVGSYVSFIDTEGNRLSMMQPLMRGNE